MKKIFSISLAAFALVALSVSCNKEINNPDENLNPANPQEQVNPVAKTITITATLSDQLTKVSFDPIFGEGHKPTGMAHKWQEGDVLRIFKSDNSAYFDLALKDGYEGLATGEFTGEQTFTDDSYNVTVVPVGGPFTNGDLQIQDSDGSTDHLHFVASATGVTDLMNIELSESSNIIGFIAKLPTGAAATINELEIEKSTDDFVTSTSLTIQLTNEGDTDDDGIMNIYANVPASWEIPANTKMFLRFKSSDASHTVYTRYHEFANEASIVPGKFNYIKLNCIHIDQYAGGADAGSATAPYLIADKYQMNAVHGLASTTSTTYFKMIDNVDMSGITYTPINEGISDYTQVVDFDGNNKTISKLGKSMFYVFKGSIRNLTLDNSSVIGAQRGVLSQYIQGTGHTITNVDVSNGKMGTASSNAGGLVGRINSGSSGVTSATITDCDVTNTSVKGACAGGLLGSVEAKVVVTNCSYSGGTVTGTTQKIGGFVGVTDDNIGCTFTDCRVENVTVDASAITGDATAGGFVGLLGVGSQVKGCKVGTSTKKVTVKSGQCDATNGIPANTGGFAGVNYGIITQDDESNKSKAYVTVTTANSSTNQLNLGGFVGAQRGTISYSEAVVSMDGLVGLCIGGFAGYIVGNSEASVLTDHCTVSGTVSGNDKIGGFVGVIDKESGDGAEVSNCSASSNVSGSSHVGGFAGEILSAKTLTNNESTGTVTATSKYVGGFAGRIAGSVSCSSCGHSTGAVNATMTRSGSGEATWVFVGGFAGYIGDREEAFTGTISQCYVNSTEVKGVEPKGDKPSEAKSSTDCVGGFAGGIGHKTPANNTGKVVLCKVHEGYKAGSTYVGGFAGISYAKIEKCRISGTFNIRCYGSTAGGAIGYQQGNHVKYCYSNATITHNGKSNIGGLIGNAKSCTVDECWSSGNLTNEGSTSNQATWGGMIGTYSSSPTFTKLIRWNHGNNNTIAKNASYANCYVKTSSDNNFTEKALYLGWSNDGNIWTYKSDGSVPTLVGLD